jgi:hypothetical protein
MRYSPFKSLPMKFVINICLIFSVSVILLACRKGPGEGGNCTITGKVYGNYYNKNYSVKIDSNYVPLEDVYVIFGDDITYGVNQKTNYDGTYAFRFLRPGHYKVFAYSRDSTGAAAINRGTSKASLKTAFKAVIKEVDINSSGQTVTVPNIVVIPK